MALLHCASFRHRDWVEEPTETEIRPVMPSLDGPRGAYDVCLKVGEAVFHNRYSVWSWQTGHCLMCDVAWLFRGARHLLDAMIEMEPDPYYADSENEWQRKHLGVRKEPVRVLGSIGWLQIVLAANTQRSTSEPLIWGQVFASTNWTGGTMKEPVFLEQVRRHFVCSPDVAEQFGRELLAECEAAEDRRNQLGQHDHEDYLAEQGQV